MDTGFGLYLKFLRNRAGLTLAELSESSGVSFAHLSRIENGKRGVPKYEALQSISNALGIPFDDFMEQCGFIHLGIPLTIDKVTGLNREMTEEEHLEYLNMISTMKSTDTNVLRDALLSSPNTTPNNSSHNLKDLKKFLEQSEIMFDGVPMTEEDKSRIQGFMEGMFWEAKQMNKRKKDSDN